MRHTMARRGLLIAAALVFVVIAIASLLIPHQMAEGLGYRLDNVDALNEYRAVYVGVWMATAIIFLVAARHIEQSLLGDLAAILILGQTAGRVLSCLLDGFPSARVWPMFILELVGGVAILLIRPQAPLRTGSTQE